MALDFPNNPNSGDSYTSPGGPVYDWDGVKWVSRQTLPPGERGPVGFTGSQGIQGNIGFTGSTGFTGSVGFVGSVGFTGSVGSVGSIGFTGSIGFSGSAGFTGSVGFVGSAGVLLSNRTTTTVFTGSISNETTANISATGFRGYLLYKINTSASSWVRVYTDQASRTSDAARVITADPSANSGILAEVITTGNQTIRLTPGVLGFNDEATPTASIPLAVTNKSGATANISVTLTIVRYEN
jgi:hypothetical protein